MLFNIVSSYVKTLILSISLKNFTEMGKFNRVSADTIQRKISPADESEKEKLKIAQDFFHKSKILYLICDETFSHHSYSKLIEGTDDHYDSKIHSQIRSHKILTFGISNGTHILPLSCNFLFGKLLQKQQDPSKFKIVQHMILKTKKDFAQKKIIFIADGAFSKIEMLKWCVKNRIDAEFRIAKSCKITLKNKAQNLKNIEILKPKGKQKSRTIQGLWHDMKLFFTAQLRVNKKGKESIVYQVSTLFSKPSQHVKIYQKRWTIEKMFRTTKQYLGLQDCQSTKMKTQLNHISAVFLAYTYIVVEQRKRRFKTPEDALRAIKLKNASVLEKEKRVKRSIKSTFSLVH